MKQRTTTLLGLFIVSFSFSVSAQQSVMASGNNATGSGGSSSYSVGQVAYTTNSGTNGNLTQGVQQPFEISTLGIDNHPEIDLQFAAYPNPTNDFLTLSTGNNATANLQYQLFDITGKLIENNKIKESETSINMSSHETGIYFLEITENSNKIKTFKIIKK